VLYTSECEINPPPKKVPFIPKGSLLEYVREENQGENATQVHLKLTNETR